MKTNEVKIAWAPKSGGYTMDAGGKTFDVRKVGKTWRLFADGVEISDLGRRASFDHAEGELLAHLDS